MGRVPAAGEPQWLDTDRGYALAWKQNKDATCSCGTRPDEWAGDPYAYMADTHFCRGHQVLAEAKVPQTSDGKDAPGWFTFLRPATDADFED